MAARQCPFCGKIIADTLSLCPFCRESMPPIPGSRTTFRGPTKASESGGNRKIRQGLLYMLLAAVIQYLAGGYGGEYLTPPIHIQPVVASYLTPLLFLGGLGLSLYGFFLYAKPEPR